MDELLRERVMNIARLQDLKDLDAFFYRQVLVAVHRIERCERILDCWIEEHVSHRTLPLEQSHLHLSVRSDGLGASATFSMDKPCLQSRMKAAVVTMVSSDDQKTVIVRDQRLVMRALLVNENGLNELL